MAATTVSLAVIVFKTIGAAHIAGAKVAAAHSLAHSMGSGHLAAMWMKKHLKDKLIGDLRDRVIEELTKGIPSGAKRAAVQALLADGGQISIEDAIDIVNAEIDEKYKFPEDMRETDVFYMAFKEITKKDGFLDKFKCNFLNTGENSTAKAKYSTKIANLTNLTLHFKVRDYTGRVLAVRMPGKVVLDRYVKPREVVEVPTSEDWIQVEIKYQDPKTKKLYTYIDDAKSDNCIYSVHDVRESYSISGSFALETMSDWEALEDRMVGRSNKDKKTNVKCPKKHELSYGWARRHDCDICKKPIQGRMWSCRQCNWDAHKFCVLEIQDPNFDSNTTTPKVVVTAAVPKTATTTPHAPNLSILGNAVRVQWNHKTCPSDATHVCVFGKAKKSETKFRVVDSSNGNKLLEQGKNQQHHAIGKGFVDVLGLKVNETFDFKLVFYGAGKWGTNGPVQSIQFTVKPPHAPLLSIVGGGVRVKWNHKPISSNVSYVCVFGRESNSETKFRVVDSCQNNRLEISGPKNKHHAVGKGFVDVTNLKASTVYEFKLVFYSGGKWGANGALATIKMGLPTPHVPFLRVLNKSTVRVTWNHKICPSDVSLVCVYGKNVKSKGKFMFLIPASGTLQLQNPKNKYFLVKNGHADVKNLKLDETYEFKLVFHHKSGKWGPNGGLARVKVCMVPPAPRLTKISTNSISICWSEIIPQEDVTFVCVWGKIAGSTGKFFIADMSQTGNALTAQNSNNKYPSASSGSIIVSSGLKPGTKYEFRLTWYFASTKKWGTMGPGAFVSL